MIQLMPTKVKGVIEVTKFPFLANIQFQNAHGHIAYGPNSTGNVWTKWTGGVVELLMPRFLPHMMLLFKTVYILFK
jgi:hypothetical protein